MQTEKLQALYDQLFSSIQGFVERSISPIAEHAEFVNARNVATIDALAKRVTDLEKRLAEAESKRLRSVA